MRELFNHTINLFWTAIAFYPVVKYWYNMGIDLWFIIGISISLLTAFVPKKFYYLLQLSNNRNFYEKLGVKTIRKFVQNGDFSKKIKDNGNSSIIESTGDAKKYLLTIEMNSRFHWACFLFFTLSTIYAISTKNIILALIIFSANVLYNITAILLQQYNSVRIHKLLKKIQQK